MKILVISSLTSRSGSAIRFWSICRELGRLGHRVWFMERAPASDRKIAPNVTHLRSPVIGPSLLLDIMLATVLNTVRAVFIRPDIVFALKPLPNSCLPALAKRWGGAKIVLDVDDLDYEYYQEGLLKRIVKLFYSVFPHRFHKITIHTAPLLRYVQEELGIDVQDTIFLPQGIDYAHFRSVKRDENLAQALGLAGRSVLVYCASLGITSDLRPTLTAVRDVIHMGRDDLMLLVIGGGERLDEYKELADELGIGAHVVFTGHVTHSEVPRYTALGAVALNYLTDNEANRFRAPIKIREYLALGIPVVCNLVGDTGLFRDYVLPFDGPQEYRARILEALEHPHETMIRAGQELIAQEYDWANIVPKFGQTLEALVSQSATHSARVRGAL